MASEKLLQIQKDTTARLEKQAELERQTKNHQDVISLLQSIKQNDTTLTQALIGFLSGHTTKTEIVNQLKSVSTPDVDKVVVAVGKLEELVASKDVDFAPVVEALRAVEAQLEQIPKEHQELPESKEVDFAETNKRLDAVLKAIQSLDLVVEAPKVDVKVPKAQVNVEKVDLTEIKQPLLDILGAFQSFEIPEQLPTDLSTVEDLLKKSNELLKKIKEKPVGGGGGGGAFPYKDPSTGFSVQVATEADGSIPVTIKAGGGGGSTGGLTDAQLRATPVPVSVAGGTTELELEAQTDILEEIQQAIKGIATARGVASDLRVTIVGGTVNTVSTLTNQTQVGGYQANNKIPAMMNLAALQSNINNVAIT